VEVLRDLLAGVKAGVGGLVLVVGEQGVGKSSLLRAGLGGAEGQGCRLLWGAADELGQRIPLWLMAEVLGTVEGVTAGDGVMGGDAVAAGVERLLAAVDRLCAESPVVLVAEDLHWADEASLLMWHRLSRAVAQLPLVLAGSCRSGSGNEDLGRLRRAAAERGGSVLDLGPLGEAEVGELAGALAGGRPGRRLAGVVEGAGGNPLYARELVDGLVRERRVRVAGGVAELSGSGVVRVPVSLAAAIEGRLGALRWAALLGQEFSVADLEVVSGRSAGELMRVVDAAVGAGVVAEAGVRLGFRHGLIRQALYESMPAGLRAALHLQAARMLAGAGAAPERVAAQLVPAGLDPERAAAREHGLDSAVPGLVSHDGLGLAPGQETGALAAMAADEWVVGWLAEAAPVLIYRASRVAEELLRAVLGQLPGSDPRRAALEANLVAVLFRLERYRDAERAGMRLLAGDTDPQRVAETSWLVAFAMMRTGRAAEALVRVAQGLAWPGLTGSQTARLRALQAMTLNMTGDTDQAEGIARQALAESEKAGDRLAAGYALHALSTVSFVRRERAAMLEHIDRALSLIEMDPQATDLRLVLLSNRSIELWNLDRRIEAIATARQTLVLAERAGTPRVHVVGCTLGHMHFDSGEWDDALTDLEQAAAVIDPAYVRLITHGTWALIAGHRGDRETAARHLRLVENEDLSVGSSRTNSGYLLLARSLAAEQDGRLAEAMAVLAECFKPGIAERMPAAYTLATSLARLALASGDRDTAATAARLASAEAEREPLPFKVAIADHCRGLVAGDPVLVLAAVRFMAIGHPLQRAQALEDAAALEAGRGELTAAQRHLAEAVGIYSGLGAAWDVERAGARLRPSGVRPGRAGYRVRPATGWDALTPTEVKVAYLVADGRSNPDVAAALFLSRNTVQTHVSHILAKLGARSRAEIIREAVRHPPARRSATA
jgi:DNA-binding CsgD family transcriptional regulator/tetratricopeptide (TPR) repeat protein